jgi:hypothetical protein
VANDSPHLPSTGWAAFLTHPTFVRPAGQFIISGAILVVCLSIILAQEGYSDAKEKWAMTIVGAILGYWFK